MRGVNFLSDDVFDRDFIEDYQRSWRIAMEQKCSVVCFRENSEVIVGLNLQIVVMKNDTLGQERLKWVWFPVETFHTKLPEIFSNKM